MTPTTYGYKIPDAGDKAKGASGWFAQFVYNFNRFDTHSHDGIDSTPLNANAISAYSQNLVSGDWVASGSGYKQTVTVPSGITELNNFIPRFVITSGPFSGQAAYLGYKRLTATTFEVYSNDNSINLTIVYR